MFFMDTFNQWMNRNRRHPKPIDEFVETCLDDNDKPKGHATREEWREYLREIGAEGWEFDAFEYLWEKFQMSLKSQEKFLEDVDDLEKKVIRKMKKAV